MKVSDFFDYLVYGIWLLQVSFISSLKRDPEYLDTMCFALLKYREGTFLIVEKSDEQIYLQRFFYHFNIF